MKIKIINYTTLKYEEIGQIIDKYINDQEYQTHYFGKVDWFRFKVYDKIYLCQVRYMKSGIQYLIENEKMI